MSKGQDLPQQRSGFIQKFRIGGHKGWLVLGYHEGAPRELCIILESSTHPLLPLPEPSDELYHSEAFAQYYSQLKEWETAAIADTRQLHLGLVGMLTQFGIAVSMGLKHGVPLKEYCEKFAYTKFPPDGVTTDPDIRVALSIPDFVARKILVRHLKEETHEPEAPPQGEGGGGPQGAGSPEGEDSGGPVGQGGV